MDKLLRYRRVLGGAATRILASTSELLQDSEPAASDLIVAIDDLEEKDATLNQLNAKISDLLDGQEFEDYIEGALKYHDEIRHTIRELQFINEKFHLRTENTRVRAVPLPTYLLTPKAVKRDSEKSSTVQLGETQTDPVELTVARAPEETHIEPPPCQFEYIFVPDLMKGESLPQLAKTLPAPIFEVAQNVELLRESELEVGNAGVPFPITSAPCEETARSSQETAESCLR